MSLFRKSRWLFVCKLPCCDTDAATLSSLSMAVLSPRSRHGSRWARLRSSLLFILHQREHRIANALFTHVQLFITRHPPTSPSTSHDTRAYFQEAALAAEIEKQWVRERSLSPLVDGGCDVEASEVINYKNFRYPFPFKEAMMHFKVGRSKASPMTAWLIRKMLRLNEPQYH